jgi:hypothetical protein
MASCPREIRSYVPPALVTPQKRSAPLLISCISRLRHILAFNFLLSGIENDIIRVVEMEMQE